MSDSSIKIDTAVVRTVAENVSRLNGNINHSFDELTRQISALNRDWDGAGADRAMSSFSRLRADYYQNRYAQVQNFVQYLVKNVAGGYEAAEENNRKLSDVFK